MNIDLNADLGEGGLHDAELLQLVTSANIACGGHAGGGDIMKRAIELAMARGVALGAHPGYEDREHFGRRELQLPLAEVRNLVTRQIEISLTEISKAGGTLHHVKPHGALYNQANRDAALAQAVVDAIQDITSDAVLYAPPSGEWANAAKAVGMRLCAEGFADRRYQPDGSLVPRSEPGAVIEEVDQAVTQAIQLANSGKFQTLCVHGDGVAAVAMLKAIRGALVGTD